VLKDQNFNINPVAKIAYQLVNFTFFSGRHLPIKNSEVHHDLDLEEKNIGTPEGTEDHIAIFVRPQRENIIVSKAPEPIVVDDNPHEVRIDIYDVPCPFVQWKTRSIFS
jgi:hypothetical protein